ncbi:hypothetical protein [Denitromonas iodatirespirans]|uniref:Uncharacterized protein n=1 Tax=Denitromonas iodatirespirans TaxID=2795389 RepID=A0A944DEN7_DENI1|nr:hypothetical protein [Denitromonas iodatirespirans]MBT0962927.1 hypothetical protein [Denitromonas iodatirespirans]
MRLPLALILVGLIAAAPPVDARGRYVVVNGQRLDTAAMARLDRAACLRVPDGRYWIDMRSGIWGYEGGAPQGRVGDNCRQRPKSLSERGLLYSPGELLR